MENKNAIALVLSEVLSGFLIFGAAQQVAFAILPLNHEKIAGALILFVLAANDAIFILVVATTKGDKFRYDVWAMIGDLLTFFLLSLSMVVLNPEKNLFELDLDYAPEAWCFWLLLGIYWFFIMAWTHWTDGFPSEYRLWHHIPSFIIAIIFLLQAYFVAEDCRTPKAVTQWIAFIYPIVFFAIIRPKMWQWFSNPETSGSN